MDIKVPGYIKLFIALMTIVLAVTIMKQASSVLIPLLVALLLSILISPFTNWLDKRGMPSIISVFISLIALLGMLTGLGIFFYNQLLGFSGDIAVLEARVSDLIKWINEISEQYIDGAVPISFESIQKAGFQYLYENIATLTGGIIATATSITVAFMVPIFMIFLLYYRRFLIEFVLQAFGANNRKKSEKIIGNVKEVVQNYIVGMFIVICILAVLNSIALLSLGIRHALLFAVFAAFLNIIPFVGPFIAATLPIAYALLTTDSLWYPIGVFLAFYVIQLLESNLFTPKIVGGKVAMNPLMTILALFIGNHIWGIAGMILFIPGIAILKVILDEIKGMEPYAFLLGDIKKTLKKDKQENAFNKNIKSAQEKIKKFKKS